MTSGRRVAMYVMPVAVVSVALNIPKFMETQATVGDNSTEIEVADMRLNPTYMLYYTISQIFHPTLTTGLLPMAALIYMNTKIFFGEFGRAWFDLVLTFLFIILAYCFCAVYAQLKSYL